AMGAILEALRFSKVRFVPRTEDLNRLWNATVLLFIGVALYLFLARRGLEAVGTIVTTSSLATRLDEMREMSQTAVVLLRWLPFVFYPFIVAALVSRTATLPWEVFSIRLKAMGPGVSALRPLDWATGQIHPGYLYFALVLFASCAGTARSKAYLPLLLSVVALALWPWRSRRYRALSWAGMYLCLLVAAVVAEQGIERARQTLLALEGRLIQNAGQGDRFDQLHGMTAIGAVGRLKQSGRIILRVRTPDGTAPGLLREAVFNRFRANVWGATHREFQTIGTPIDGHIWRFSNRQRSGRFIAIARYTAQGEAPIALPTGTIMITNLPALAVETNYLGSARMHEAPPLVVYAVEHGPGVGFDGPPDPDDTNLDSLKGPDAEAIEETAQALGLKGQPPDHAVSILERYFATKFEYTRRQDHSTTQTNSSALAAFLRESHAGHCEYFAAATVLLLRAAGVPARYAVGFSPGELRGDTWLARARDAHAWCLAWINGRWQDVDTTPGTWRQHEAATAGWSEAIRDWFSDAWYRFALWRQRGGNRRIFVFAGGMIALSWLGWRQLRGSRWRRAPEQQTAHPSQTSPPPGLDSEFFAVAEVIARNHDPRLTHETPRAWLRRLSLVGTPTASLLDEALQLHYRLRFDPQGLTESDRRRLRELATQLLQVEELRRRRLIVPV
ncbi:MAG: DUF4129 domain-containing transglutaminase family protein, partial [Verrucomicrobiia bacterium]